MKQAASYYIQWLSSPTQPWVISPWSCPKWLCKTSPNSWLDLMFHIVFFVSNNGLGDKVVCLHAAASILISACLHACMLVKISSTYFSESLLSLSGSCLLLSAALFLCSYLVNMPCVGIIVSIRDKVRSVNSYQMMSQSVSQVVNWSSGLNPSSSCFKELRACFFLPWKMKRKCYACALIYRRVWVLIR